jgi:hypothetical protein
MEVKMASIKVVKCASGAVVDLKLAEAIGVVGFLARGEVNDLVIDQDTDVAEAYQVVKDDVQYGDVVDTGYTDEEGEKTLLRIIAAQELKAGEEDVRSRKTDEILIQTRLDKEESEEEVAYDHLVLALEHIDAKLQEKLSMERKPFNVLKFAYDLTGKTLEKYLNEKYQNGNTRRYLNSGNLKVVSDLKALDQDPCFKLLQLWAFRAKDEWLESMEMNNIFGDKIRRILRLVKRGEFRFKGKKSRKIWAPAPWKVPEDEWKLIGKLYNRAMNWDQHTKDRRYKVTSDLYRTQWAYERTRDLFWISDLGKAANDCQSEYDSMKGNVQVVLKHLYPSVTLEMLFNRHNRLVLSYEGITHNETWGDTQSVDEQLEANKPTALIDMVRDVHLRAQSTEEYEQDVWELKMQKIFEAKDKAKAKKKEALYGQNIEEQAQAEAMEFQYLVDEAEMPGYEDEELQQLMQLEDLEG